MTSTCHIGFAFACAYTQMGGFWERGASLGRVPKGAWMIMLYLLSM